MASDSELSSNKLYEEASDFMSNDQFDQALEIYTLAIEKCDPNNKSTLFKYYIGRSQAYLKLNRNIEALNDADAALGLNSDDSRAFLVFYSLIILIRTIFSILTLNIYI